MRMISKNTMAAGVLAITASFTVGATDLSSRFTDTNGDMVADAPTDSSEWVDPNTLIFAYTPLKIRQFMQRCGLDS